MKIANLIGGACVVVGFWLLYKALGGGPPLRTILEIVAGFGVGSAGYLVYRYSRESIKNNIRDNDLEILSKIDQAATSKVRMEK